MSHFCKIDWILYEKSGGGDIFFINQWGDNRVTGDERGALSPPEFSILASICGWGGVNIFSK